MTFSNLISPLKGLHILTGFSGSTTTGFIDLCIKVDVLLIRVRVRAWVRVKFKVLGVVITPVPNLILNPNPYSKQQRANKAFIPVPNTNPNLNPNPNHYSIYLRANEAVIF